ncbi:FUSC family protein [uncultured Oxalicibacterium sp.]|uniref:FUSC family protein n=1 Tax=uncultured Oxalicibacterium sp. TaxID=1168540 RepID=UPI0025FDB38F|nr:FUSC family protein [uncultured Oxalicibacterium sp.]
MSWMQRVRVMGDDWLASEGQRWLFAIKTLIAAFLALWIAFRLGFDSPRSAMMTVFIVALPSSGQALEKSIYRLAGTLVGCLVALMILAVFPQQPVLLFLALACWVAVCTSGSALMRNARSYGFVLAGYTACMIAVPAIDAPLHVFDLAISRVTEISVGILCAAFVNDALFPRHQSDQLVQSVRGLYHNVIQLCHDAMQGRLDDRQMEMRHLQFAADVAALESGRAASWFEAGDVRVRSRQLHAFNSAAMVTLTTFHTLHRLMHRLRKEGHTEIADQMQTLYASLADALFIDGVPARTAAEAGVTAGRLREQHFLLRQQVAQAKQTFLQQTQGAERKLAMETALELFQRLQDELLTMVNAFHALAGRLTLTAPEGQIKAAAYSASTPPMIAVAAGLRSAAALLLLALAWHAFNWPSAAGAVIIAVIFCGLASSSPNPGGMIRQTTFGFALALPFAFVCAFFLLNHVEGYDMLVLAMAPFLLAGAYASTWKSIMGIGIGFNLMFAQMVAPENMMRFDVASFLNDSIAQIVGLVLAACMFALILPRHRQGARVHIERALWREAERLGGRDVGMLRHRFESRVRDLLNQLHMGLRGIADARTRRTLNLAITLLEAGHALLNLQQSAIRLTLHADVQHALQMCAKTVLQVFASQGKVGQDKALAAIGEAGRLTRQVMLSASSADTALLQSVLTDLHLLHTSLADMNDFSQVAQLSGETDHVAA